MGKVKIKRKSTLIDMTAMSDVTVLLLTFFMLTSTFVTPEPITVISPSAVSTEEIPKTNLITVLVTNDKDPKTGDLKPTVFLSLNNENDTVWFDKAAKKIQKKADGTDDIRTYTDVICDIIKTAVEDYNGNEEVRKNNPKVVLTDAEIQRLAQSNVFGSPMQKLKQFLELPAPQQEEALANPQSPFRGIPVDLDRNNLQKENEFKIWMKAARTSYNGYAESIKTGEGVAIKADRDAPYEIVDIVMNSLQSIKMNKMKLITTLKGGE